MRTGYKEILILVAVLGMTILTGAAYWTYHNYFSPLKIGFSAGLSGSKSELGVNGRNGAQLAIEEINGRGGIGGRKLELVIADDKNDPQAAREADRYLDSLGIRVIIGHMISGVAETTVAYANEQKLLMISPTIATEKLTGIDDYFIRTISSNAIQGRSLALATLQETAVRRVAVVYDQNNGDFAKPIIKAFGEKMAQSGGMISHTEAFQRQGDFKKIIESIRQNEVDGVLLIASALDAGMFCQQSRKQGAKLPMFLPMWAMTNDFLQAGGEDADGAYLISQVDLMNQTMAFRHFRQRYQERYGEEPTFASVMSYDATMVAAAGIKAAGANSAEQIKAAILRIGEFQGLQRSIKIDTYGDMQDGYYLYRVQAGKFQKVGKL